MPAGEHWGSKAAATAEKMAAVTAVTAELDWAFQGP